MSTYPKIAQLKSNDAFRERCAELGIELLMDEQILTQDESPLAQPIDVGPFQVGNRWCIHPMEGWDGQRDGAPSELTFRRWRHFGSSGAKLIWGGEAAAVRHDGRANPHQLMATPAHVEGLRSLRLALVEAHQAACATVDDLLVGLQLTHSGRFCRPNSKQLEPRIAYHHPLLDAKFGMDPDDEGVVWTDEALEALMDDYLAAARVAVEAGFRFVDIKACHGYLLHEFLSARSRPGPFGGSFEGRTRLLCTIVERVRAEVPELLVVVRLSVFDVPPFRSSTEKGRPMDFEVPYTFGFGASAQNPMTYDLDEPLRLIDRLQQLGVAAINLSCGSPYYSPHIQRPAIFPPSDGYQPPEDPLVGVSRQVEVARAVKQSFPDLPMVGSGYSYLQDYLPQVAQALVRAGWIDLIGLGRMVLSYPELPRDSLSRGTLERKRICRTFSDCTTAPRHGIVSGCFPLDPYYKKLPQATELRAIKRSE